MRTMLYAHRGANRELPENTMEAFERAVAIGADALEIDVHMSRDGVVVVAHDPDGWRTAKQRAAIRATSFSALGQWDVGRAFFASKPGLASAHRMPSLEEVLETFREVFVNIDVKQTEPDMVPATVRAVRRASAEARVRLTSFSSRNTRRINASPYRGSVGASRLDVAWFAAMPTRLLPYYPVRFDALQIPTHFGSIQLASKNFIGKARGRGLRVDYWTINDADEARSLLERGATGIVTDDIRTLVNALRNGSK